MNKGSTLELALAVHEAGGYPSFCSWSYNRKEDLFRRDLDRFTEKTNSNCIHVSFELHEYPNSVIQNIIETYKLPTVELIYGNTSTFKPTSTEAELEDLLLELLLPIKACGTKIFKRIYEPVSQATTALHLLDGFCIKGAESAGFGSHYPVKETFLKQRELTPNASLIPYGGVGTAEQVKEYMDLGAEMVAVGTVLALSSEGSMSDRTKQAAVAAKSKDLVEFTHSFGGADRKQSALQFGEYLGPDDPNGTIGLVRGLSGKDNSHVYFGHGIDHVTEILPCKEIIQNLTSLL
jgi:NAD(P)H-dependent flavin oxidoreductase YrpB (nitropropane dioxygenase family)